MNTFSRAKDRFLAYWFVCRITSDRKSAQYGSWFSYPIYIALVTLGVVLQNPYLLALTMLIALFGVILPMHPFDYIYNHIVTKLIGTAQIPGRGTELQVNSTVAVLFNLIAIVSLILEAQLNYQVLALIYVLSSVFFIAVQLTKTGSR